jgi:hypothetical protein
MGHPRVKSGSNEQIPYSEESHGKPSVFACPECRGVLWELEEGRLVRYRCRVGHGYTARLKGELDESAGTALAKQPEFVVLNMETTSGLGEDHVADDLGVFNCKKRF